MMTRRTSSQLLIVISALFVAFALVICETHVEEEHGNINPYITEDGKNYTVREGETLRITCTIHDKGPLSTNWNKGEKVLFVDIHFFGDKEDEGNFVTDDEDLVIKKTERTNAGDYICYIMAGDDNKIQQIHHVFVEYAPSSVTISPAKHTVKKKAKVEFTCSSEGYPSPNFQWRFNKEKLPRDSTEVKENGRKLIIPSSSEKNAGIYTCIASNGIGSPVQSDAELLVLYPPIFPSSELEVRTIKAEIGKEVILSCDHTSNPAATITWTFRDEEYPETSSKLILKNVTQFNEGTYKCHVSYLKNEHFTRTFHIVIQHQADEAQTTVIYKQTDVENKGSSIGDQAAISNNADNRETVHKENTGNGGSSMTKLSAIASHLLIVILVFLCLT